MDTSNDQAIHELIGADLRDSLDEELELELDDHALDQFRSLPRRRTDTRRSTATSISRSCSACRASW